MSAEAPLSKKITQPAEGQHPALEPVQPPIPGTSLARLTDAHPTPPTNPFALIDRPKSHGAPIHHSSDLPMPRTVSASNEPDPQVPEPVEQDPRTDSKEIVVFGTVDTPVEGEIVERPDVKQPERYSNPARAENLQFSEDPYVKEVVDKTITDVMREATHTIDGQTKEDALPEEIAKEAAGIIDNVLQDDSESPEISDPPHGTIAADNPRRRVQATIQLTPERRQQIADMQQLLTPEHRTKAVEILQGHASNNPRITDLLTQELLTPVLQWVEHQYPEPQKTEIQTLLQVKYEADPDKLSAAGLSEEQIETITQLRAGKKDGRSSGSLTYQEVRRVLGPDASENQLKTKLVPIKTILVNAARAATGIAEVTHATYTTESETTVPLPHESFMTLLRTLDTTNPLDRAHSGTQVQLQQIAKELTEGLEEDRTRLLQALEQLKETHPILAQYGQALMIIAEANKKRAEQKIPRPREKH